MNSVSFASRLLRDLKEVDLATVTADTRLTILDAINGALQKLHALTPHIYKETQGSIYVAAPETITLTVANGSNDITGYAFTDDQRNCTIRIDGDPVDNQIVSASSLLHPYLGASGSVSATIYHDAVEMPEPYEELIGRPRNLSGSREFLALLTDRSILEYQSKTVGDPDRFWVEANAVNQVPNAPAVIRFDSLPGQAIRYQCRFTLAPSRINLTALVSPGTKLPIREEHVEIYLLPIARGILADSELWRDQESKSSAKNDAELAEKKYEIRASSTLVTPGNRTQTKTGF